MMTPTGVQDYLTTSSGIDTGSSGIDTGQFIFLVCQHGTEGVIKNKLLSPDSPYRLAFSRPGLITLKVSGEPPLPKHPLIRLAGWVLGQANGLEAGATVDQLIQVARTKCVGSTLKFEELKHLHVFERDRFETGHFGFEPGVSLLSQEIANQIKAAWPTPISVNQIVQPGERIIDCVVVDPNRWLVAWHKADEIDRSWPGGVFPVSEPEGMISRAYLKMAEAIAWSKLPIEVGDQVVEIGSAPGGASQRLLDMGLNVCGIDPAEMDPLLLEHPRFEHWRAKSAAVKRKNYARFKWLVADANVAPNYTLDCVGDIVCYPTSKIEGLILTLKLSSYELIDQLDEYLGRIGRWGYRRVEARQLGHNRHEVCVVASRG